jgi:hypothetical protein
MADFNAFAFDYRAKFDAGADYTVRDPWGNPAKVADAPVTVRLAGEESARFKNVVRELRRQNADKVLDDDERADVALAIVVACSIGWNGVLDADGKPLELTPESAREFWDRVWPYNGGQVAEFIREKANFLGNAPSG